MAIKIGGTQVISNSQGLTNITSIDSTTAAAITAGGVGGATAGQLGGSMVVSGRFNAQAAATLVSNNYSNYQVGQSGVMCW